jgi:hypothetical protein
MKGGMGHAYQNAYQIGLKKEKARKARERRQAAKGGGAHPSGPIPAGTDPRGVAAINWARSMFGTTGWYYRCLSFVRQAFGAPGLDQGAKDSWYQARNKYSIGSYSSVPAGVPIWWTTGTYGHVALTTGNGNAISTDHPILDQAGNTTIASLAGWLGAPPAGWSADINGKQIYPALRTGGTLRADTMVRAHKGETMLTEPLTRKFKDNIESGGGDSFHVTLDLRGATIKEDVDIEKAVNRAIDVREAKLGRKRVVK